MNTLAVALDLASASGHEAAAATLRLTRVTVR
jgi:hypothetical protein